MFNNGLGYSGVNTAKSAISSFLSVTCNVQIGNNALVKRFMKGIFHKKPSLPKHNCTWDVKTVLCFIKSLGDNSSLDLLSLSLKLVVLLALTTSQRCQTLSYLDLRNIDIQDTFVKIRIGDLLKQSSSKNHLQEIFISAYPNDKRVCVVETLKVYIAVTKQLRHSPQLIISVRKPHKEVTASTISKWIKKTLKLAGIDTKMFTAHSTRAAASSKASQSVPIETVLKTAGWSSDCSFRKFYSKPITNDSSFSHSVLAVASNKN